MGDSGMLEVSGMMVFSEGLGIGSWGWKTDSVPKILNETKERVAKMMNWVRGLRLGI